MANFKLFLMLLSFLFIHSNLSASDPNQKFSHSITQNCDNQRLFLVEKFQNSDSINTGKNIFRDVKNYAVMYVDHGWRLATSPIRLDKQRLFWLGGIVASTAAIYAYDTNLMKAIDNRENSTVFKNLRKVGDKIEPIGLAATMNPVYVTTAVTGYMFGIKPLEQASVQLHETLLFGAIFRQLVVHLTGRARPYEEKGARYFKFNSGSSFFSGHTTNAFEMATILSHHIHFLPFRIGAYGFAALIGFQRLQSTAHWPSDVFLGAIYGTAIAKTIIKLHESKKISSRLTYSKKAIGWTICYSF